MAPGVACRVFGSWCSPVLAAFDLVTHFAPVWIAGFEALGEPEVVAFGIARAVHAVGPILIAVVADPELLEDVSAVLDSTRTMLLDVIEHVDHEHLRVAASDARALVELSLIHI